MKNLLLLITVVVGYVFGIYFYCRGFLLTRNALLINSTCNEVRAEKSGSCWMESRFRKAVVIVIDALRYDFVAWQQQTNPSFSPFHHNKLNAVHDILVDKPQHGLLFKFVADPPTTTLQRLKALTTGSLPTFVDAGSNFAGASIEEDNIVDQFKRKANSTVVFMGDDTWVSLFPTQFSRKFAYPSFDVKDLHTVDNGVLEHLNSELQQLYQTSPDAGSGLLIAHFLGVDHCGHKFGPNHPEMASKLIQLDQVLRSVIDGMQEDSVLFVLGDHGMTQTGDHGGDSPDETGAALFVFSPAVLHREKNNIRDAIFQVDLVPTLSMLLDSPIPFSNLGAIISELFPDPVSKSHAARANVWQVVRYTENYLANYRDAVLQERFQPILKLFYSLEPEELTVEKCLELIREIGRVFVECWAKFHLGWMTLGILTISETLLWSLSLLLDHNRSLSGRKIFLKIVVFALCSLVLLARNESIPPIVGVILTGQVVLHLHTTFTSLISLRYDRWNSINWSTFSAIFVVGIHAMSQFSNSFVVYDDTVCQYACKSLFFILYWMNFIRKKPVVSSLSSVSGPLGRVRKKLTTRQLLESRINVKATLYLLLALFLLKLGHVFNRCREEQIDCQPSAFVLPFASLFDEFWKFSRISLALLSCFAIFYAPRRFLQKNGSLTYADTPLSLTCQYGSGVACFSLFAFWLLQWIPDHYIKLYSSAYGATASFNQAILLYMFVAISLLAYLLNPLLVGFVNVTKTSVPENRFTDTVSAYKHMKSNWRQYFGRAVDETTTYVYGLPTVCSCSFVTLLWTFVWLILLLLGDGVAFSLVSFLLIIIIALEFHSEDHKSSPVLLIVLIAELASHFFYAFGHHATFSSIPWDAAFVGVPGNFAYQSVQATLVILHVASSCLLTSFVIPLATVWSLYKNKTGIFSPQSERAKCSNVLSADEDTELRLASSDKELLDTLEFCNLTYLATLATKLIAVVIASAVHRRHLMVWKIFAPKFIFEGILFLFACCSIIVQYLFIYRFNSALKKFLKRISLK